MSTEKQKPARWIEPALIDKIVCEFSTANQHDFTQDELEDLVERLDEGINAKLNEGTVQ